MKRQTLGESKRTHSRSPAALLVAASALLLALAGPANLEAGDVAASNCSFSVAAVTNTLLRNFDNIFTQVFSPIPGDDLKVTAIALRSPVGPQLFNWPRTRGRAKIVFDCFGNGVASTLGQSRPRFGPFGGAAAARRVTANRNCDFLGANYSFTGNQVQLAGDPITAMTYVQRMASSARASCYDKDVLCLTNGNRFQSEVSWRQPDGRRGNAVGVATGENTGLFYFFDEDNLEATIKILDACDVNGFNNFWVFFAAATDVEYTLTVTDTQTNQSRVYSNPLGQAAEAVTDTQAFATCP